MTARQYSRDIADSLRYQATWFPGSLVSIGTVCTFQDGVYSYFTEAASLGIELNDSVSTNSIQDIHHISKDGTKARFKAEGETAALTPNIPQANAGIGLSFAREGSSLLFASSVSEQQVDLFHLKRQVLELAKQGAWERQWAIVGTVVSAEQATILVSKSSQGTLELDLGVGAGVAGIEAVNAAIDVSVTREENMFTLIRAQQNLTPLFRAWRVKRWLFIGPRQLKPVMAETVDRAASGEQLTPHEDPFEAIDPSSVFADDRNDG